LADPHVLGARHSWRDLRIADDLRWALLTEIAPTDEPSTVRLCRRCSQDDTPAGRRDA
jgi:hypothetical protein